jgi:transcriptional regulator with XRE-family HTH domain
VDVVQEQAGRASLRVLGRNVQRLRNAAKISQDGLAQKASVTKRYVQMIEAGQKCPALHTVKRFAEALGASYDELLKAV